MKHKDLFYTVNCLMQRAFLNRKIPIAVSFIITNRCNYSCTYCNRWKRSIRELTTMEIFHMLCQLKGSGTRFFQITGGEPFLREDLLDIVRKAKELGFYTGINTNGSLIDNSQEVLRYIDKITFSLDGPPEVHEMVRPKGSFKAVEEAIEIAKRCHIKIGVSVTLTRFNLTSIDYLVKFAEDKNIFISFQPADIYMLSGQTLNPVTAERKKVIEALNKIICCKKRNRNITNSVLVLRFMKMWPDKLSIDCAGGSLFCRIESNGDVMVCGKMRGENKDKHPNILKSGVEESFKMVIKPDCTACYNITRLQINILYSLLRVNKKVILNILTNKR